MIDREWGKSNEREMETRKTRKKDPEDETQVPVLLYLKRLRASRRPLEGLPGPSGTSATF